MKSAANYFGDMRFLKAKMFIPKYFPRSASDGPEAMRVDEGAPACLSTKFRTTSRVTSAGPLSGAINVTVRRAVAEVGKWNVSGRDID